MHAFLSMLSLQQRDAPLVLEPGCARPITGLKLYTVLAAAVYKVSHRV
jgi:hypothetical protein